MCVHAPTGELSVGGSESGDGSTSEVACVHEFACISNIRNRWPEVKAATPQRVN